MSDFEPPIASTERDKPRVQSAARAIEVLKLVARQGEGGISSKRISELLELPRQVVYHLVHTLVSVDMLRKVGGTSYALGIGVAPLVDGFKRQLAPEVVRSYADRAARITGESAYAVGWIRGQIAVLSTATGTKPVHAAEIPLGIASDAHCRSSGKVLLSMLDQAALDQYLAEFPLYPRTKNTIITRELFDAELAAVRAQQLATGSEEYTLGLCCMAVPIAGFPSAMALGISVPVDRFAQNRDGYLEALRAIAGVR